MVVKINGEETERCVRGQRHLCSIGITSHNQRARKQERMSGHMEERTLVLIWKNTTCRNGVRASLAGASLIRCC